MGTFKPLLHSRSCILLLLVYFGVSVYSWAAWAPTGKVADKPLFRDPIFDGSADPVLCWNHDEQVWFMFYTNRRANVPNLRGVSWVHGTPIGIAMSRDGGASWTYRGQAHIRYGQGQFSYWAPEVLYHDGLYHMYLTFVPGMHTDWSGTRDIIHLTSTNLLDWDYQSTLELASDRVIDACVYRMPDGTWRMWYNNERDRKSIYYAESDDLFTWRDHGQVVGDRSGEGPKVFHWRGWYWMVVDVWRGLGVYRSKDGTDWTRQPTNLLEAPGQGVDDQVKGGHADVVVSGDRAYLFYFTHPGRRGPDADKDTTEQRRSSIQVVELRYEDGWLDCDRDAPTYINLIPPTQEAAAQGDAALAWPTPTKENRPWTRWWWLGSAVDEEGLTAQLTQFQQGGLGGVEICPIYGVKGHEDRHIDFLTPAWMRMLNHTTHEARRLGLGVDLTTGTGWPFGGIGVTDQTDSSRIELNMFELEHGGVLEEQLPAHPIQTHFVLAVSSEGERIDVTGYVEGRRLNWTAPQGKWRIYVVGSRNRIQRVKRAAPGAEGFVVDPFSISSLEHYLNVFDEAFADFDTSMLRGQFHDSYEYYGSSWTPGLFEIFESHHGYDLRNHIEALFGHGDTQMAARIKRDYRRTLSDLHIAYIEHWTQWCNRLGGLSRNQAHGAPANLIDLYAAADIPETEIFGPVDERHIPMQKFSSSAAHLTGGSLVGSESFTWLGEHFQTSLADIKAATDQLFLSGINHIFFHGIPYSPPDADWPGWQFYASVNMGPKGGLWRDMPAYNAYVTRCQSILQSGTSDNNVLLYYPMDDLWQDPDGLLMSLTIHNQNRWLWPSTFYQAATLFQEKGFLADYITDQLLSKARYTDDGIAVGDGRYQVIVVPQCQVMPLETLETLVRLARSGATVLFVETLPETVPGLSGIGRPQRAFRRLLREIDLSGQPTAGLRQRQMGQGRMMVGPLETMLAAAQVVREPVADTGVRVVRRSHDQGYHYFLANFGERVVDGWFTLGRRARSAVLMDPMFEDRVGVAAVRQTADENSRVYLQMQPGQSLILRTFTDVPVEGPQWAYVRDGGPAFSPQGTWNVEFIDGGPVLPRSFKTSDLVCWTHLDGDEGKRFAGTARYKLDFNAPAENADRWRLELGRVCNSATVSLNGTVLGTLICEPYAVSFDSALLKSGTNTLVVDVTNLPANRIRDLDRRQVNWKYFHDINIVTTNYRPFDASDWPLKESGLLGPVRLVPLTEVRP